MLWQVKESGVPAFWDDVVEPLTGASTNVADALRKIKKKDLDQLR